ncbi:AraC family transcriptional regulator ligand-binding domain-containing protein [Spongiibacter nanhainus]|uniref:AraC family transcriptional regulator ligand-binding domain-containing protein n=1 Tax=Spongiibacter nanhainus TaxID=2794344 RepID=A0A7T4US75_9GAMM|nr:AraC family transcriptional regulator ligand-binding domain-containing protein [Spongiibacter nanhainus]QQD19160.1 AraC family transcriptional regulator ligand-binding domain-containing protein [Spongiibacter nanhainus]
MKRFLSDEKDIANAFLRACDALGIDHKNALKELGLSRVLLNYPECFVPSHMFNLVIEELARTYHCHDFALHIAQNLTVPHLGLTAKIASFSLDLRSALNHADNYSLYYQDSGCWQHHIADGQVCLYKPTTPYSSHYYPQRNLLGSAQMFMLLGQLTDGLWQPSSISLSFPDPGYRFTDTFSDFFQCELSFQQNRDAIYFSEDYLDYNLSTADLNMQQNLETQIKGLQQSIFEDRDLVDCARMIIDQRLRFSSCSETELAYFMGVSTVELTDNLNAVATSFKPLLQQQQLERARYYTKRFNCPGDLVARAIMPEEPEKLSALLTA